MWWIMTYIVIGNVIALLSSIVMVYSGIVKTKKKVLFYQTIEVILAFISYLFLGGISGAIINLINALRNVLCYKNKLNTVSKIIISVLSIISVVYFNNDGVIGLLPLICILIYLWFMTIKDITNFKILIIILMTIWAVYDFLLKNYVGCIFDVLTILANIVSIFRIRSKR